MDPETSAAHQETHTIQQDMKVQNTYPENFTARLSTLTSQEDKRIQKYESIRRICSSITTCYTGKDQIT